MDSKLPEQRFRLELFISAKDLADTDFFSKTDPKCKIFLTNYGEPEEFVGVTEVKNNNLNPTFEKSFVIDYLPEIVQTLRIEVWDSN